MEAPMAKMGNSWRPPPP